MNCQAIATAVPAIALPASSKFSASWVAAFAKIQTMWQKHIERAGQARAAATFSDIDLHTLRDIGAPSWIIAEATQRDLQRDRHMADLSRS